MDLLVFIFFLVRFCVSRIAFSLIFSYSIRLWTLHWQRTKHWKFCRCLWLLLLLLHWTMTAKVEIILDAHTNTHTQTPFKWPWCSRSSALIQFYIAGVKANFRHLKEWDEKKIIWNSYLRYWIGIKPNCNSRIVSNQIQFDLIWFEIHWSCFFCTISHFYEV